MTLTFSLILFCTFGFAIGSIGCRQAPQPDATTTSEAEKPKATSSTSSYATTSFDLTSPSLPPGYQGHDIEAVCDLAEYPVGKNVDGLYAFKLESRLDGRDIDAFSTLAVAFKITYKGYLVDKLSLRTVSIPIWGSTTKDPWAPLGSVKGVVIKSRGFSSEYVGQNAFSAKRTVHKMDVEHFDMQSPNARAR